jgi:hypothetical protein
MEENKKESLFENKKFNLANIILLIIESVLSFGIIPLQFIKYLKNTYDYPDGHGGYKHVTNYYNMWQNIPEEYVVLLNILFGTSIIFNVLCIIFYNKMNKKYIFFAHGFFVASIIAFMIIMILFGNQTRLL